MSQNEIYELLKKYKDGLTTSEIANILNKNPKQISSLTKKMRKWGDIYFIVVTNYYKKGNVGLEYKYFLKKIK